MQETTPILYLQQGKTLRVFTLHSEQYRAPGNFVQDFHWYIVGSPWDPLVCSKIKRFPMLFSTHLVFVVTYLCPEFILVRYDPSILP